MVLSVKPLLLFAVICTTSQAKSIELQTISVIKPNDEQHTDGANDQAVLLDKSTNQDTTKNINKCRTRTPPLWCSLFRYGRRDTPKLPPNFQCEIGNILCQLWHKKQGLLLTQESVLRESPLWTLQVAKKSTRAVEKKLETKSVKARRNKNTGCKPGFPDCRWPFGKRAGKGYGESGGGKVVMQDNSKSEVPCSNKHEFTCGVFYGRRNDIPTDTQASQVNNNSSKNTTKGWSTITPGSVNVTTRESIASPTATELADITRKPLLEIYTEQPNVTSHRSMQKKKPPYKICNPRNPNCRGRLFIGK